VAQVDTRDIGIDVAVLNGIAYMTDGYGGVEVIDVSTPTSPALLGTLYTPGYAFGIAARGDDLYVTSQNVGLLVGQAQCATSTATNPAGLGHPRISLGPSFPNPFSAHTAMFVDVAQQGRVALAVYDARGRLVRSLFDAALSAGTHWIAWDGRDDAGRGVSTGVYYIRAAGEERAGVQRVVRMQ
jgi:hypothetical protein